MPLTKSPELAIPAELIEAIRSFPAMQQVSHCGQIMSIPAFEIYADCPHCGKRIKVRSFAGTAEIEDVFDAVFAWIGRARERRNRPAANGASHCGYRRRVIHASGYSTTTALSSPETEATLLKAMANLMKTEPKE